MEGDHSEAPDAVSFHAPALLGSLEEAFNGLAERVELLPGWGVPGNPGKEPDVRSGMVPVGVIAVPDAGLERAVWRSLEVAALGRAAVEMSLPGIRDDVLHGSSAETEGAPVEAVGAVVEGLGVLPDMDD